MKFRTGVYSNMLITILMFIFSKFCHSYMTQIWYQNLIFSKFDTRAHCDMLITVLMCNISKYLPFINFWSQILCQNVMFSIFTEIEHKDTMQFHQFGENKME